MSNLILFFYLSLASARPALLPAVLPLPLSACLPFISQFATSHMDFISFMCSFLLPLLLYSFLASASSPALIPFHCARLSSRLVSGISHTLAASFLCSAIMIWLKMGIFVPANVDSQLKSMACTIGASPVAAKD